MLEIKIDKSAGKPLFIQIRDSIKKLIDDGSLSPGDRLPTVNKLSQQIGVTPSTIRRAFKDLVASGYTHSHVGRGTFVNDLSSSKQSFPIDSKSNSRFIDSVNDDNTISAASRLRGGIKNSLNSIMSLANRPGVIQFTGGHIDQSLIKKNTLKGLINHALKKDESLFYMYDNNFGLSQLRESLAERFSATGSKIKPEQILITSGSQQVMSLMAQVALKEKLRVICETPCYLGIFNSFDVLGKWVESAPRDLDGPTPDRVAQFRDGKPTLFYLCPRLHNPMGTDLSLERKQMLLSWANEQQVTIISDEIFSDFYYESSAGPGFMQDIQNGNVYVTGSFSKTFLNGLRVGWVVSSEENINSLAIYKQIQDLSCPPLVQGIANSLLITGEYDLHLTKIREHYKTIRDVIDEELEKHMPDSIKWISPKGGFHYWVELPKGYSSVALFLIAVEKGVSFIPGPLKDIDHRFVNALDLNFGTVNKSNIPKGIKRLAAAIKELLSNPPSDHGLSGIGML